LKLALRYKRPLVKQRELCRLVAQLLPRVGGAGALLDAAVDAMSGRKGEPGMSRLASWTVDDDALGQIYQAINAPVLERAYRSTALQRRKFTAGEIPAVTQLFTPKWVVEFLLHNTLGRLWRQMHPDSRLQWEWAVDVPAPPLPPRPTSELRICDPACGTMNFGLVAVDMLRAMYREEQDRAGAPGWPPVDRADPGQIDSAIVGTNLFGVDIDPLAIDLARRSLEIKIGKSLAPGDHNLRVGDALLDQGLAAQFDIVVTNPPYLSARNLPARTVARMKRHFPTAWRDAYACFIAKSLEMLRPGGRAGILSMHSFMFTGAFERLRRQLARDAVVQTVAHFGPGLFDVGNPGTLQTAAMVLRRGGDEADQPAVFFRLVDEDDKAAALRRALAGGRRRFSLSQRQLAQFPRSAWMYWVSPAYRRALRELPKLGEIAPPRQGLATTDNARFVRYWWEVEAPGFAGARRRWLPYAKGGRFRRWYEAARHRVDWEDDGRRIKAAIVRRYPYLNGQWQWVAKNSAWYGRPGITYSYLTSGSFSARLLEEGTLFDVAGSALFPDEPAELLGILNSSTAQRLLEAINPTVNFQVGDLRQFPVPRRMPEQLPREVARAVRIMRQLESMDETSTDFIRPAPWDGDDGQLAHLRSQLEQIEREIDRLVAQAYRVKERPATDTAIAPADRIDLARRWISWCLGMRLGRFAQCTAANGWAGLAPLDPALGRDVHNLLAEHAGEAAARQIAAAVGGLERFFAREFVVWHNRLYRGRPVFWCFSAGEKIAVICGLAAERAGMRRMFRWLGVALPAGWKRSDDGIAANLTSLAQWVADPKLASALTDQSRMRRRIRSSSATASTPG
jgi:hypothetical protein